LEFYSAQMPKTGVADPLTPTGAPLRVIEVPHPLKLMFDIMVHANRREVIKAEFMNDDFESCEREALATMISDLAGDFQLLETGVQQVMTDLQGFRDETKDALVTLDADVVNLRREAAVAFRNLAGQVDRRTSNLDAALNARANELKLKLDTAEGMLLLILDEVD
jgi:hypothetical protein